MDENIILVTDENGNQTIENTSNTNTTDDQLAKDTGTEDIPTK